MNILLHARCAFTDSMHVATAPLSAILDPLSAPAGLQPLLHRRARRAALAALAAKLPDRAALGRAGKRGLGWIPDLDPCLDRLILEDHLVDRRLRRKHMHIYRLACVRQALKT